MPYIPEDQREELDLYIDLLHQRLELLMNDGASTEGMLNYLFTRLLRKTYGNNPDSYKDINDSIGVLSCCLMEHYRRFAVPYEEQKRFDNGDVEVNKSTPDPGKGKKVHL